MKYLKQIYWQQENGHEIFKMDFFCVLNDTIAYLNGVKSKAIPLQAWTGPEGSGRLRRPDFKTIGT